MKALAEEVAQWDQMIAAMFGTMKDAAPEGVLESPIPEPSRLRCPFHRAEADRRCCAHVFKLDLKES